jgi:3-phytase
MPFAVEAQTAQVLATVETTPVPSSRDAADDPAIWVHPTDPAQSTIIGTDKRSGLAVYDLTGAQLQFIAGGTPNNVDLRYNFPLGGQSVALVGVSDTAGKKIDFYRVNPTTRLLETVVAQTIATGIKPYGFCMYHSPGGKYYAFVLSTSAVADVQQWELFDNGSGKVSATKVRSFTVGSTAEGCVADDYHRVVYLAEENVGIWKYGAEPEDGTSRTQVDAAGASGHLEEDVEGLTIYYASQGTGYLIASSQGNSTFVVYTRVPRPQATAYVKTFKIGEGNGIDRVQGTDGIEVLSFPLGSAFPQGLFVAQDGDNSGGNQNFKLVPWEGIAHTGLPQLTIDPTCDPRKTGAGGGGSQC